MGRWARPRFEQAMFEKTVKLYDKVIEGAFGKAGDEMDLRLATFIQKLDPESKEVQACFATLVQTVLWDKPDSRPDGPRVVVEPVAEPDVYPPGPRSRRLTRSPHPEFRSIERAALIPTWSSLLDRADEIERTAPAAGEAQDLLNILPWSSAPPSRAHSPSARRRASPPLADPRLRSRSGLDRSNRSPSPLIGRSTWELVDLYSAPGEVEEPSGGLGASPPQSPSRAWLDEYTAARPFAPRPRPRTALSSTRARAIRRDAQIEAEQLAAEIEAPPPLRQTRTREYEASEQRAAQRRRIIERRAGMDGDADSPWVPYGDGEDRDRDPYPQIQPPSLRRGGSGYEIRDAAGRVVSDYPPRRAAAQTADAQANRDTRRDGLVFEPLSPALPSSAISAASGHEGRFGPSYHLPGRSEGYDVQTHIEDALAALEDGPTGTSRNFGLGMRSVSVEGLMGVAEMDLPEPLDLWARTSGRAADSSLVDTPPIFGRVDNGDGDSLFTRARE